MHYTASASQGGESMKEFLKYFWAAWLNKKEDILKLHQANKNAVNPHFRNI